MKRKVYLTFGDDFAVGGDPDQPEVVFPLPAGLPVSDRTLELERILTPARCRVCGHPLERSYKLDANNVPIAVGLQHSAPNGKMYLKDIADHLPVPVANRPDEDQVSVCDFCCVGVAAWTYECLDFVIDLTTMDDYHSIGGWMACNECHDDVEAGNWHDLTARWWEEQKTVYDRDLTPREKRLVIGRHRAMMDGFREHRIGEATPG